MKQKVSLVLGSGGARGSAHIGVIRELISHGYEITSISGSSMGALVGGVYASGKLTQLIPVNNKESIGYFQLMATSTSLMLSQISKLTLEMNPPDLLINISGQTCGTFDFHKAKELVETGRVVTRECLEKFEKNNEIQ